MQPSDVRGLYAATTKPSFVDDEPFDETLLQHQDASGNNDVGTMVGYKNSVSYNLTAEPFVYLYITYITEDTINVYSQFIDTTFELAVENVNGGSKIYINDSVVVETTSTIKTIYLASNAD